MNFKKNKILFPLTFSKLVIALIGFLVITLSFTQVTEAQAAVTLDTLIVAPATGANSNIGTDPIRISLTWSDPTGGATWEVHETGTSGTPEAVVTSPSAVIQPLDSGVEHCYTVLRVSPDVSGPSNELCSHIQPEILSLSLIGPTHVKITWAQAPHKDGDVADLFRVERVVSPGGLNEVCDSGSAACDGSFIQVTPSGPGLTHTDTTVVPGTEYCYEIEAQWIAPTSRFTLDSDKMCILVPPLDTTPPTVTTTVSDNFITDADDPNTFTVVSTFSEAMDATGANDPVISFSLNVADTLALTGGVWSAGNTVYTTSYDIDVSSQELDDVVASTTAAADVAGNPQNADTSAPAGRTFDVDTINPTLSSVSFGSVGTPNAIYAKAGQTVKITFTASESIGTPTVTIGGIAATSVSNLGDTWEASRTMTGTDTEGTVTFTINFSDLALNAGTQVTSTTDSSSVLFDRTAPSPELKINGITPPPDQTFSRSVSLETTCGDGPVGSGCATFVVGGTGITDGSAGSENFNPSRPANLTPYRGIKTVEISSVTDNAGNVADGPFPDTIALDPRIVNVVMFDDGDTAPDGNTPYWLVPATFTGTVENIADPLLPAGPDTITFDFGSPFVEDIPIDDGTSVDGTGTFSVTDSYLRISEDGASHQPSAGLFNSGLAVEDSTEIPVTADGPPVIVQPHPVTSRLSHVGSAPVDETYSVRGVVDDDLPGFDNPSGLSISFSDLGGIPLYVATTGGVTLEDPDGFEIDSCPTCVARLSDGSEIRFDVQRSPRAAVISLRDMGMTPDTVTFEVTTGPTPEDLDESEATPPTLTGPPDVYDVVAESKVANIALVTITNTNGIAKIKVKDSTDNEIGVSQIQSFTTSGAVVNNVEFSSDTASPILGPQSYDNGGFFSEGLTPSPAATYLVTTQSAATLDYEASASEVIEPDSELPSHQRTLLTLTNPSSGFGGGTQPTELITLLTRTGSSCSADADGDAICDDWEDGTIPFNVVTYPGGIQNIASCDYTITPAPVAGEKDLYYEIDAMTGHNPIDAARTAVTDAVDTLGINLNLIENELNLDHVTTISVWTDTNTPVVGEDIDDFNSIKNDRFGSSGERPTISTQNLQLTTVTGTGGGPTTYSRTLTISGITVTTPNAGICPDSASDNTQGRIVIGAKLTLPVSSVTVSAPASGLASLVAPGAGLNLRLSEATTEVRTTSPTVRNVIITIPFWTDSAISSVSMGTITLPMTLTKSSTWTGSTTPATLSGSPQITSTLLDARSLVYRYMLFAHSQGGSSGAGETLGNDIVVTLGSGFGGEADGVVSGGTQGTQNEQAGTMMHEIGHNLGLAHGGKNTYTDSSINCKPNYPSIMTYSRQMDYYLGSDWVLAFSDGGLSSLEEDNLSDVPLVNSDDDEPVVIWGSPGLPNPPAFQKELATLDKDWNDNGNEVDAGFSTDLTNFGIYGCGSPSPGDGIQSTLYYDHNDEADFRFNFGGLGGSFDGSPGSETFLEGDVAGRWQSIFDTFLFNKPLSPAKATGIPTAKAGSSIPINFQLLQLDGTPSNEDNPPYQTPTPPTKGEAYASVGCSEANYSALPFDVFKWIVKTPADLSHLQVKYKSSSKHTGQTVCYKLFAIDDTDPLIPAKKKLLKNGDLLGCPSGGHTGCFKLVK